MEDEILSALRCGGDGLLLVGEGDFSFSVALFDKIREAFVATTVETRESLAKRHAHAVDNVDRLEQWGCRVRYEVDATLLHKYDLGHQFCCIVFNFPHIGGKSNIKRNRELLKLFFMSASRALHDSGRIMVTLCQGQGGTEYDEPRRQWQNSWQVTAMAAESQLILTKAVPFSASCYPEYGSTGYRSQDKHFRTDNAVTHVFVKGESNDIVELRQLTDDARACHEDIFLNHVTSRCLITREGHPCNLLLDVLASTVNGCLQPAPPLLQQQQQPTTYAANSRAANGGWTESPEMLPSYVCNGVKETVTVVHRIERLSPDGLLATTTSPVKDGDATGGFVGLRYVAYVTLPADNAPLTDLLGRLFSIRFVKCVLHPVTARQQLCDHGDNGSYEALQLSCRWQSDHHVPVVIHSDKSSSDSWTVGEAWLKTAAGCGLYVIKLDLTAMAFHVFGMPAERWLWSSNKRLLASCRLRHVAAESTHYSVTQFVPWSFGAPSYSHDLSLWIDPESFSLKSLCQLVQNVSGLCVLDLRLIEVYCEPGETAQGSRCSHCYRIRLHSVDAALTHAQSYACYQRIRCLACTGLGYAVR